MYNEFDQKTFDKAFKEKLLDTFKRAVAFLEENNIRWCACGGTVLGAVRHKGIIPWDDDIDIWVLREDYNKLVEISTKLSEKNLEFISLATTPGYYNVMSKICDKSSTLWDKEDIPFVDGVYIDIFPLDQTNVKGRDFKIHQDDLFVTRKKYQESISKISTIELLDLIKGFHLKALKDKFFTHFKRYRKKYYFAELIKKEQFFANDVGDSYCAIGGSYNEKEVFPKEWLGSTTTLPFEDILIRVPIAYDKYLSHVYGDYMTPPPIEKQVTHHLHYYANLSRRLTITEIMERRKKGYRFEL